MRVILQVFLTLGILLPAAVFADVVTLKTGAQISGAVESGTTRDLRIRTGGRLQVIPVEKVQSIRFDADAPAALPDTAPGLLRPDSASNAAPPPVGRRAGVIRLCRRERRS